MESEIIWHGATFYKHPCDFNRLRDMMKDRYEYDANKWDSVPYGGNLDLELRDESGEVICKMLYGWSTRFTEVGIVKRNNIEYLKELKVRHNLLLATIWEVHRFRELGKYYFCCEEKVNS